MIKLNPAFRPKLWDTLQNYNRQQFYKDIFAGLIVGIVALPLAIAFGIASGVPPEKGLITAVIGGLIVSALGGSRVQIGGPTGAFIVIVYGIIQHYGIGGLWISTLIAGVLLIAMGIARFGNAIKFIPHSLIIGFTSGIALIIFSSQIKDFLGLKMGAVPADFIEKWDAFAIHFRTVNPYALLVSASTTIILLIWPKFSYKIPGSLVAILLTTFVVHIIKLPVETIGSRFGSVTSALPAPAFPHIDFSTIRNLFQPAITIALLAGIESLLSAVVADGMIGGNHRSNAELIAQGIANISSTVFGGIPVTGAIARTATNVKNGGRTPIAGIIHALTLLIIMLAAGKWAVLIPLPTLAGILVVVAFHMSEWQSFISILKGPKSDAAVLVTVFLLTVLIDLTVAIEVGMVLAAFLFIRKMIRSTDVTSMDRESTSENIEQYSVPQHVEVFEINGPLFFGAAYKFKDAIREVEKTPRVLIIRMRKVPIIDVTGIRTLQEVYKEFRKKGTRIILSEVESRQVLDELRDSRLQFAIGKSNITQTFPLAIQRAEQILKDS
ncbi:MAG: sodium-independent anion transporter [Bacteroidetes bacterium]|nr:MAG: sodium-independent anion transporter [Bacteroidota bacterium]